MSYKITWEVIFEDFKVYAPHLADRIYDWYPSGQLEIAVILVGGEKLFYDYINKTYTKAAEYNPDQDYGGVSEEDYKREFSRQLKRRMIFAGITQESLAERTGISKVMLSNYMNAKSLPSTFNLFKIAQVLRCSTSDLSEIR